MSKKNNPASQTALVTNQKFMLGLRRMVENLSTQRAEFLRRIQQEDENKSIDEQCKYPTAIGTTSYWEAYRRGDVARRLVDYWPKQSWRVSPEIYEVEDEVETPFEQAWKGLNKKLRLLSYLARLDCVSGIGRFGVMFLGFDDGQAYESPLSGFDQDALFRNFDDPDDESPNAQDRAAGESTGDNSGDDPDASNRRLLFVRVFDETKVRVAALNSDKNSPRCGLPEFYNIDFLDAETTPAIDSTGTTVQPAGAGGQVAETTKATKVHWTRVFHAADNRVTSEIFGLPRLELVWNRLLDLKKVAGGSANAQWRFGYPGLALEMDPEFGEVWDEEDKDAMEEQMKLFSESLTKVMAVQGGTLKELTGTTIQVEEQLTAQLQLIAIAMDIPMRVLMGSEEGQLASEQDRTRANVAAKQRQLEYVTPFLLEPFLKHLVAAGVLPMPKELLVEWPDLFAPGEGEKADTAKKVVEALSSYSSAGLEGMIPPLEFLTVVMGWTADRAKAVLDAAMKVIEENGAAGLGDRSLADQDAQEFGDESVGRRDNPSDDPADESDQSNMDAQENDDEEEQ